MTKQEIINYMYENHVQGDFKIEEMAEDLAQHNGTWLMYLTFDDCYYATCNRCNETQVFYYNKPLTNFCPNCGADMREGEQDG